APPPPVPSPPAPPSSPPAPPVLPTLPVPPPLHAASSRARAIADVFFACLMVRRCTRRAPGCSRLLLREEGADAGLLGVSPRDAGVDALQRLRERSRAALRRQRALLEEAIDVGAVLGVAEAAAQAHQPRA